VTIHGEPSRTALTAAAARAAHLIVDDEPVIFADTLAQALLGERAEELISYHRAHGTHPVLAGARAQVICRSRYAEDRLAEAIGRGTRQYVLLGAGLDSFAYRSPLARQVRVFEVDHPATQEYKRRAWAQARAAGGVAGERVGGGAGERGPDGEGAGVGFAGVGFAGVGFAGVGFAGVGFAGVGFAGVGFAGVELGRDSLGAGLERAGFAAGEPALVSWLGVTMYLAEGAIEETVAVLGGLAAGSEVVMDYMLPARMRDAAGRLYADLVGPATAEWGEPWRSVFAPEAMAALLARHGFGPARDVGQRDMVPAAAWDRSDALRPAELCRIAHAAILRGWAGTR
jgi:O-methyltransferase involved in polyketide biosynthesis